MILLAGLNDLALIHVDPNKDAIGKMLDEICANLPFLGHRQPAILVLLIVLQTDD